MNIYRWILFPLISAILLSITLTVCLLAIGFPLMKFIVLLGFIVGGLMGFVMQFYNEYKTRKVSPNPTENAFDVNQTKQFVLFNDYAETFDLCLEFINQKLKVNLKSKNFLAGTIELSTGMSWNTNGNIINFNIRKITDTTTEVEIFTAPRVPTTIADCGDGLKIIDDLTNFLEAEIDKKNLQMLEDKTEIPFDFHTNHSSKIKLERN